MKIIRKGDRGPTVLHCQELLKRHGFYRGKLDGDFGPMTASAVYQFQAASGLLDDGIVGDRTWSLLSVETRTPPPDQILIEQRIWLRQQITPDEIGMRRDVLEKATDTFGWKEMPDGSNGGPRLDQIVSGYYDRAYEAKHGKPPWCALAVSWWLREGLNVGSYRNTPFGARFGAVFQIEDWGRNEGCGQVVTIERRIPSGAIFTMGRKGSGSDRSSTTRAGHTGLVIADTEDGKVLTIEGNTGNMVAARKRKKSTLRMFIEWWK